MNWSSSTIQRATRSYKKSGSSLSPKDECDCEWVFNANFDNTRRLIGESYAGTSTVPGESGCDWAVNHITDEFSSSDEDKDGCFWYSPKNHGDTMRYCLSFPMFYYFQERPLVVATKRKRRQGKQRRDIIGKLTREGESDRLLSAAIVIECTYNKSKGDMTPPFGNLCGKTWEAQRLTRVICKLTTSDCLPKLFSNKEYKQEAKYALKKLKKIGATLSKWHEEEMSIIRDKGTGDKDVYWNIAMIGVDPENQGKGYGRQLLEKIATLADEAGVTCCLQCTATTKSFFDKMGYHYISNHSIEDPIVEPTSRCRQAIEMFLMVRRPMSTSYSRPEV